MECLSASKFQVFLWVFLLAACGGGGDNNDSDDSFTVSTSAGAGGSISPTSATVSSGDVTAFTVTPNTNFSIDSVSGCSGSLSGSTYTTGAITADCTVTATFVDNGITTYTVSTVAGAGGNISPGSAVVNAGDSTSFTITPDSGFVISGVAGCNGSLSGSTYTTGAVIADCTVIATFVDTSVTSYTVTATAGTGGSVSPASVAVNEGSSTVFTVTPNAGFVINSVSGCNGSLAGDIYTTGSITVDCVVTASFMADSGGNTNSTYRIKRVEFDYDNNGQVDAVSENTYNNLGQLTSEVYTYIGDGTADNVVLNEENALQVTMDFSYDSNDRLSGWDRQISFINPSSVPASAVAREVVNFSYDSADRFQQFTLNVYDRSGALSPFQPLTYTAAYNAQDQMNNITSTASTLQTQNYAIDYATNGLPELITVDTTINIPGAPTPPVMTNEYEWNTDSQNTRYRFSSPSLFDPTQVTFIDQQSIFNGDGLLATQIYTSDANADKSIWTLDSTVQFDYDTDNKLSSGSWDLNSNGSIDAVVTVEWEEVVCEPVFFWYPLVLWPNNLRGFVPADAPNPAYLPGLGINTREVCHF